MCSLHRRLASFKADSCKRQFIFKMRVTSLFLVLRGQVHGAHCFGILSSPGTVCNFPRLPVIASNTVKQYLLIHPVRLIRTCASTTEYQRIQKTSESDRSKPRPSSSSSLTETSQNSGAVSVTMAEKGRLLVIS